MLLVAWVIFAKEFDTIHKLGHPGGHMVITVETYGTICDGFRPAHPEVRSRQLCRKEERHLRLAVRTANCHLQRSQTFLELAEKPRACGEPTDEPHRLLNISGRVEYAGLNVLTLTTP
jgi:hypothetical protein